MTLPENIVPFLVPGRLIKISITTSENKQQEWGWGILVNFTKQKINPKNIKNLGKNRELQQLMDSNEAHYVLDVYLYVSDRLTNDNMCQPGNVKTKDGRLGIVPVILHASTVHSISSVQVFLPQNHKAADKTVEMMYFEVLKRFEQGKTIPQLDPVKEMDIESKTLSKLLTSKATIEKELEQSEIRELNPNQESLFERKSELKASIKQLSESIQKSADMIMSSELVSMKRVMRRLDLCDKNDVPTLKGKVAAHISTSDEILLTEMLFSGLFNDMEQPSHIAAVLSCLVYTEGKSGSQEGVQKIVKHEKLG